MGRTKRQISRRRKSPAVSEKMQESGSNNSSNRADQSEKKRMREKTGNDERGEGEGNFFCQAKCCNHPPPGRKVLSVKLSQVSGGTEMRVMSIR